MAQKKGRLIVGVLVVCAVGAMALGLGLRPDPGFYDAPSQHSSALKSRALELGRQSKKNIKKGEVGIFADEYLHKQWGLGMIESQKAWSKHSSQGPHSVVVAIIDTGIDTRHPDLKNNLWRNPGESGTDSLGRNKATNGIDDDQNGYVDDVHGWNFVRNNNNIADYHGHGTHIAGIIGAEGGNNIGIVGIAPKVRLMVLKYYDPTSSNNSNLQHTINAIRYATLMGAHIINYSAGGKEASRDEKRAIAAARTGRKGKGVLFVAAAGNESSNTDHVQHHYYPADYDLDNIVSVTAVDRREKVLSSSNYGKSTVDIAAPGHDIYSTLPGSSYGLLTGTSQGTAYVSGVAAVLLSKFPDLSAQALIEHILHTGDLSPSLVGKTLVQKRLNLYRALSMKSHRMGVNGRVAINVPRVTFSQSGTQTAENAPAFSPRMQEGLRDFLKLER